MKTERFLTTEVGWRQTEACGVALPAVNPVQVMHAGSRPLKHPATTETFGLVLRHIISFYTQKQMIALC